MPARVGSYCVEAVSSVFFADGGHGTAGAAGLTSAMRGSSWSMATEQEPSISPAVELAPASERGEYWWPVALAIVVVVVLHVVLPARYRVQPAWVVPVVLLTLLAVMMVGDPGRIDRQKTWLRVLMGIVIAFLTVANLLAAGRLWWTS